MSVNEHLPNVMVPTDSSPRRRKKLKIERIFNKEATHIPALHCIYREVLFGAETRPGLKHGERWRERERERERWRERE